MMLWGCATPQQATPPPAPQPSPPPAPTVAPLPPPLPEGPVRIGLLLPLTGNAAQLGNDMLDAAQLALFDVGDNDLVLLPRDTGDGVDGAANAARSALDEGAQLLIGPLFSGATRAVAPLAAQRNVKVLSFSNDAGAAGGAAFVLGFRPEEQVQRIVEFAHRQGLPRVGALVPEDAYGARVLQAWRSASTVGGGMAGPYATYPAEGDPTAAAGRLFGQAPAAAPSFDALLLPDSGQRLRSILGALSFHQLDTRTVRLLGTMLWQDDASLASEPGLQGAWMAAPPPDGVAAFARRFEDEFGRKPAPLAGLAYDATALAAVLIRGERRLDEAALTAPSGFAGRLGIFRLLPSGLAEHGLAVVELSGGSTRLLDTAPAAFSSSAGAGY